MDKRTKNDDEWVKCAKSFLGDDGFESFGLSRFFPPSKSEQEIAEEKRQKELEKAEKKRKAREDWKNTPILTKLLVFLLLLLPIGWILWCCLH